MGQTCGFNYLKLNIGTIIQEYHFFTHINEPRRVVVACDMI